MSHYIETWWRNSGSKHGLWYRDSDELAAIRPKCEEEGIFTMKCKIIGCDCVSDYQDKKYGKGNRVHNECSGGKNPGDSHQGNVEKIDSAKGREIYRRRFGVVEPVFGNIRSQKRLNRFTLRGKIKVNIQWLMYCMVHNIEKIMRYGAAWAGSGHI